MSFRAGIRALQGLTALVLMTAVPALAEAQGLEQAPPAPVEQGQLSDLAPASATPPVAPPPLTNPPAAKTPTASPAPKPLTNGPVDALKAGQFRWAKQDVNTGPMKIVIVVDIQRIYIFQNDKLVGFSTI